VTGVDLGASGASVQIAVGDATQTVEARWVIGCDGMHSQVREAAGIAFKGAAYQQGFILADVHMDWPLGRGEVTLFLSPAGLVVVAPLPKDRFRVVATVDDPPEYPSVPYVQALLDERGPTAPLAHVHDSVWSARFKVHHRVAESPRKGHVLLCGDAAHVHSPAGGQGMNTGIQDAVSLAQALANVIGGGAEAGLDAWAADRHKIAEDVVALTDRMTRMATLRSPAGRALRNVAIGFAGHIPAFGRALARNVAELGRR
jgi:2-polyprenyl-6-methoxyphenol hydroxylase-like FAD-dependent oxidoreductase